MRWYIEGEATNNRPTDLSGFEVTRLGAHTHSIILPNFLSCSGQHNFYAPHTFGIDGTHRGPPHHSTQELVSDSWPGAVSLFLCGTVAGWLDSSLCFVFDKSSLVVSSNYLGQGAHRHQSVGWHLSKIHPADHHYRGDLLLFNKRISVPTSKVENVRTIKRDWDSILLRGIQ